VCAVHNADWFDGLLADLVDDIFDTKDWHQMRDYPRVIQKPRFMSPKDFLMRMKHLETITLSLPEAPTVIFTLDKRKRNFLQAHHVWYRVKFDEANLAVGDESLLGIHKYFQKNWLRETNKVPARSRPGASHQVNR
jgi:hypothetical protein